jgi:alpha-glucosidase
MHWLDDQPAGVLAFTRDATFACVVNLCGSTVPLPPHVDVLLASGPLDGADLPSDTAVWLRTV